MDALDRVPDVCLIHAGEELEDFLRPLVSGLEDNLKLGGQVDYKLRYNKNDNIAAFIIKKMKALEGGKEMKKGVIIISERLCQVMRNNKEMASAFERLILKDQESGEDRIFALLWAEDINMGDEIFKAAFSSTFVHYIEQHNPVVRCGAYSVHTEMANFVEAILKRWLGPMASLDCSSHVPDPEHTEDIPLIERVRIVHHTSKERVRGIAEQLADGFELDESPQYKLYNRVKENQIPDIILAEAESLLQDNEDHTLGVVLWCAKLLQLFGNAEFERRFADILRKGGRNAFIHLNIGTGTIAEKITDYVKHLGLPEAILLPVNVASLTDSIKEVLSLSGPVPSEEECYFSSLENDKSSLGTDDASLDDQKASPPPKHHTERQLSEISQPKALASEEGAPPHRIHPSPALIGNPCNQNPQGGRVVMVNGSWGTKSTGYVSSPDVPSPHLQQGSDQVHGQPVAQQSGSQGCGVPGAKVITNAGDSWNTGPSDYTVDPLSVPSQIQRLEQGVGRQSLESRRAVGVPSLSGKVVTNVGQSWNAGQSSHQSMQAQSSSPNQSEKEARRVHGQPCASDSSSDQSKFVAGNNSMPVTSLASVPFGSKEPVFKSQEQVFGSALNGSGSADSPASFSRNRGNKVYALNGHGDALLMGALSRGAQAQPPSHNNRRPNMSEKSEAPGTNKWAPTDCGSTEMPYSQDRLRNQVVRPGSPSSIAQSRSNVAASYSNREEPQPHSFAEASQTPAANKVARRVHPPPKELSAIPLEHTDSSSLSSLPQSTVTDISADGQSELLHSTDRPYSSLPTTSATNPSQPNQSFDIQGLMSRRNCFTQCTEDDGQLAAPSLPNIPSGPYAHNPDSKNALQREDEREIGVAQRLPAFNAHGPAQGGGISMPSPAGHPILRSQLSDGNGERVNTSPAHIGRNARLHQEEEEEEETNPGPPLIKHMNDRCKEQLKIILDPPSNTVCNWQRFADQFGMKYDYVRYLQHKRDSSPTLELLNWLTMEHPHVTCADFKEVARKNRRMDVVKRMSKFKY